MPRFRIPRLCLLVALALAATACSPRQLPQKTVTRQEQAGSVQVAVLSVERWQDAKESLQPKFELDSDAALELIRRASAYTELKSLGATDIQGQFSFSDLDGGPGEGTGPSTNLSGLDTASLRENPFFGDAVPALDPHLEYLAAAALKQEVELINRYIEDAAVYQQDGFEAFVVRLQISLQPGMRYLPYDVYTTLSFLPASQWELVPMTVRLRGKCEIDEFDDSIPHLYGALKKDKSGFVKRKDGYVLLDKDALFVMQERIGGEIVLTKESARLADPKRAATEDVFLARTVAGSFDYPDEIRTTANDAASTAENAANTAFTLWARAEKEEQGSETRKNLEEAAAGAARLAGQASDVVVTLKNTKLSVAQARVARIEDELENLRGKHANALADPAGIALDDLTILRDNERDRGAGGIKQEVVIARRASELTSVSDDHLKACVWLDPESNQWKLELLDVNKAITPGDHPPVGDRGRGARKATACGVALTHVDWKLSPIPFALEQEISKEPALSRDLIQVVPMLVTDNIESAIRSNSQREVMQAAISALGSFSSLTAGLATDVKLDTIESALARDLNGVMTVGRAGPNAMRVRFGAMQVGFDRYAMAPRTHNVTTVVVVPKKALEFIRDNPALAPEWAGNGIIEVIANTEMRHATNRYMPPLRQMDYKDRLWQAELILKRYDIKVVRDIGDLPVPGYKWVYHKRLNEFVNGPQSASYQAFLDMIDGSAAIERHHQEIWAELMELRATSPVTTASLRLPKPPSEQTAAKIPNLPKQQAIATVGLDRVYVDVIRSTDFKTNQVAGIITTSGNARIVSLKATISGNRVRLEFPRVQELVDDLSTARLEVRARVPGYKPKSDDKSAWAAMRPLAEDVQIVAAAPVPVTIELTPSVAVLELADDESSKTVSISLATPRGIRQADVDSITITVVDAQVSEVESTAHGIAVTHSANSITVTGLTPDALQSGVPVAITLDNLAPDRAIILTPHESDRPGAARAIVVRRRDIHTHHHTKGD